MSNIIEENEIKPSQETIYLDSSESIINLAKEARHSGNILYAKELLNKILNINPSDTIALIELVKIAKLEGDWPTVKRLQEFIISLNPDNIISISDLIKIAKQEGDLEHMKELLNRILEIQPDNVISLVSLSNIFMQEGDLQSAKKLLNRILEIQPENVISLINLVNISKQENDWQSVKILQAKILLLEPDNIIALNDLGRIAVQEGNLEQARPLFERVLQINPHNILANDYLSYIYKNSTCIEENSDNCSSDNKSDTENNKNKRITEIRKQLYSGSIQLNQLQELTEEFKDDANGTTLIAEICLYLKQPKLALQALKGYKKSHPEMSPEERKRINIATQIANSKQRISDSVKWNSVYPEDIKKAFEDEDPNGIQSYNNCNFDDTCQGDR